MTFVFALIGSLALGLLYVWLASAIVASWLSQRKGYGEKPGLATGLLLSAVGAVIWLLMPARERSAWKEEGLLPRRRKKPEDVLAERPAPPGGPGAPGA
jgi:hypothetical protein